MIGFHQNEEGAHAQEYPVRTLTEALAMAARGQLLFCANCTHCRVVRVHTRICTAHERAMGTEKRVTCSRGHWHERTFKLQYAHRRTMRSCPSYSSMGPDQAQFLEDLVQKG